MVNDSLKAASEGWRTRLWNILRWPFRFIESRRNIGTHVSTRLTREGLQVAFMAMFVLLGAVLRDVNLLVILAGTLLATLLIQWRVCAKTLGGLTVTRRLPRAMHARKPFDMELSIRNSKRWLGTWLLLAQDRLVYMPGNNGIRRASQGIGLLYPSIPPNSTRTQHYQCVVQRHGRYQLLGTELTSRFPMGLMRGIATSKGGEAFIVQPALGRLLPGWLSLFDELNYGVKHRKTKSLSDEGDFFGLRSYRPGDSPRWIHWRSSARRDELVVKQFQQADSRELIVLLDLHHLPNRNNKDDREAYTKIEDLAVEFVATIVNHMASNNFGMITVAIADATPTIAVRLQSKAQCSGLLDRLAVAHTAKGNELTDALSLLEREHHRIRHLLVVSTRPQVPIADLTGSDSLIVFWRSMNWLNVGAGELSKYFAAAE